MALLLLFARRELRASSSAWSLSSLVKLTVPATLLLGGVLSVKFFMSFNMFEIAATLLVLIIYSATVYFFTFDKREREFLGRSVNRVLNFASRRDD
jgi:ammonia channel protein AmtB